MTTSLWRRNKEAVHMMQRFSKSFTRQLAATIICALSLLLSNGCANTPKPVTETSRSSNTPSGKSAPRSTYPMPPTNASSSVSEYGFTLLDGSRMKLADYSGKVLVLDFWATYCPPCREEIPELIELQRRFGPQGLNIVGLNVGGPEDRPKVAEFVRSYRIQYILGYPDTELVSYYMKDNDSIPQTIVLDRKGRLVKHFIGYDKTMPAELEQAITQALAATEN